MSADQKASILRTQGGVVPTFPVRRASGRTWWRKRGESELKALPGGDVAYEQAVLEWKGAVESLFAAWLAAQR